MDSEDKGDLGQPNTETKDARDKGFDLEDPKSAEIFGKTLCAGFRYQQRTIGTLPAYSSNVITIDGKCYSMHVEIHPVMDIP